MAQRKAGLKQGLPLQRRTELGRGTTELKRNTPMPRSLKPLPKVNEARQARKAAAVGVSVEAVAAKPKRPRYTGPPKPVKDKLAERSGGVCEYCGEREATEAHHRLGRKAGGTKRPWINKLSNLVHLDLWCHAKITNTNGHRDEYEEAGFLLREGLKPWKTPVEHARLGRVLLLDDGDTKPAPRKAA